MILQLVKVAVVDRWEQMMLDLHVKTTSQKVDQVAVSCDVMRCDDLVCEEVLVELLGVMRVQVVDLGGDHETHREEVDGQDREKDSTQGQAV